MSSIQSYIPMSCKLGEFVTIQKGVVIGEDVRICNYCNLYGCTLEDNVLVGAFTEIQSDVVIGEGTRVQSHSFIPSGTRIGKNCFVSHSFTGVNDEFKNHKVNFNSESWGKIIIEDDVIVGSGSVVFPVTIKKGAIIAAGSVLKSDVNENEIWGGVPAKFIKMKS